MSASQPHRRINCPDCGAELQEKDGFCWLCHLAVREGAPTAAGSRTPFAGGAREHITHGGRPLVNRDRHAAFQFSLATIMLSITLVAVLLGTVLMSPGLGILLVVLVAPAYLRTCIVTVRRKARGESVSLADTLGSFALTLGMMIILIPVVIVAILVALIAICTAMLSGL